jgi:large subunit ribosomal protein L4
MKLDLLDTKNKKVGELEVSEDFILAEPNVHLVHELLLYQHRRVVRKASAKTRSEVRGGGAKPWKQKGTGRARAGSIRSPLWKGGGVIFGPQAMELKKPHMPKRAKLKALCSAVTLKKNSIKIIDSLPDFKEPKTKLALDMIEVLAKGSKKILLIADPENHKNLKKSFSNVKGCKVIDWNNLNPHDLFNSEVTLTDQDSIKKIETWLLNWKVSKRKKEIA